MRSSPGDTPIEAGCWLFWADQDCGLHSDFSWSHLWSHSYRFRGVRSGLPSLGSGASRPNRTGLNHQPQNSKAREGQPSAGSNPAATASLTRPNAGRAATSAQAFLAVVSNVVSIGPIGASLLDHRRPSRRRQPSQSARGWTAPTSLVCKDPALFGPRQVGRLRP